MEKQSSYEMPNYYFVTLYSAESFESFVLGNINIKI